jgi:putative transposase
MARGARVAPNGHIYHVLIRGNNRQNIFREEKDFWRYFDILRQYKLKYDFRLYHYVLMTNHVHLVMETTEEGGGLSEIMKGINQTYARCFKKEYGHTGYFWENRFKSILVSKDDYLLACGSYVELNPVRARMVNEPGEYKWSSYRVYQNGEKDGLVDRHPIYEGLSADERERRKRYREFVLQMFRERDGMTREMTGRRIYGNESFIKELGETLQIGETIKPRGRQIGWRKAK